MWIQGEGGTNAPTYGVPSLLQGGRSLLRRYSRILLILRRVFLKLRTEIEGEHGTKEWFGS